MPLRFRVAAFEDARRAPILKFLSAPQQNRLISAFMRSAGPRIRPDALRFKAVFSRARISI